MKVSIFSKLLFTYAIVIFVAMSMAGVLQYFLLKNYLLETKEKELLVRSKDLATIIKPILIAGDDPHEAINSFNRAERVLGTEAWVMDSEAKVIAASAEHLYCEGNTLESADLKQLKAGQTIIRRGQSRYFKEAVIRVVEPLIEKEKLLGAIILYTPVTGVNEAFYRMERIYAGAALFGIMLSFALGLVISRYITNPLKEVSHVAHEIAEGNFGNKVRVGTQDELGQLGKAINYMTEKLAEYEKMRRDFVANVSHELRSPLTSIQGFLDALVEGKAKDKDEQQKYLQILQKETRRLTTLVNDLMEISRFDSQGIELNIEPFPISSVINRAVASLRPQLNSKNLTLKSTVLKDIPLCLGDEDRVEQVIHNLLENAVRYSPEGGKILISATRHADEVLVEIADEGPGIPREELPRIWERFYRVDKARSRSQGGTGLGLAIVQEIIKKHGGQIMVNSRLEEGTVFGFTLPLKPDDHNNHTHTK